MKKLLIVLVFIFLPAVVLFYPARHGLIMLPLDLLMTSYQPWAAPGTMLVKNPYMQDSVAQMFPWKLYLFRSIREGTIPYWNPYQFYGMPFMASAKPMVFYPFIFFGLLGDVPGWNLLLFSQLVLSVFFMYLCLRAGFNHSRIASYFAGITFGWSTLMIGVLEFGSEGHAILWFPLMLLFLKLYLDRGKKKYLAGLSLSLAFSILAGQLQYTAYMMYFLVFFAVWHVWDRQYPTGRLLWSAGAVVAGLAISAVQLGPSLLMYAESARKVYGGEEIFERGLVPWYKMLRLFSPDLFGHPTRGDLTIGYIETAGYFGIIAMLFLWISLRRMYGNRTVRFFWICLISSILLSIQPFGNVLWTLHLPAVTSGSADRIFVLVLIIGAVLSSFGLEYVLGSANKKQLFHDTFLFTAVFVCVAVYVFTQQPYLDITDRNTVLSSLRYPAVFLVGALAGAGIVKDKTVGIVLILVFIHVFDLYRGAYRFVTFSNPKFLYPETELTSHLKNVTAGTLDRVFGASNLEIASAIELPTLDVYNPLYSVRTARLLSVLLGEEYRSYPLDNKLYISRGNTFIKKALDVSGVKYIVVDRGVGPSMMLLGTEFFATEFKPVYEDERHSVFENTAVFPRFGVFHHAVRASGDDALNLIARNDIDLHHTVIVDQDVALSQKTSSSSARLRERTENSLSFTVTSKHPGVFMVTDAYDAGWTVTVNGVPARVMRANYAFLATDVPAGDSVIVFTYQPPYILVWIVVTGGGFLLVACCIVYSRLRE